LNWWVWLYGRIWLNDCLWIWRTRRRGSIRCSRWSQWFKPPHLNQSLLAIRKCDMFIRPGSCRDEVTLATRCACRDLQHDTHRVSRAVLAVTLRSICKLNRGQKSRVHHGRCGISRSRRTVPWPCDLPFDGRRHRPAEHVSK